MAIGKDVQDSHIVLFVDDEVEILNSIKRQISIQDDFEGIFESNPTKVLEILEKNRVDIIVADIVMPELDGITLLRSIKDKYPHIIRILLTAHGDYNTSMRAIKEADVFGFITKPWEKNYLFGHLHMAAKAYDRLVMDPLSSQEQITTMFSFWDDTIGSDILSYSPTSVNINLDDIASRCFMSSSGFFGYTNRFEHNLFSMPLNDIKMSTRIYLDRYGDKQFGLFIIAPEIPDTIESELDNLLKQHGELFSTTSPNSDMENDFYTEVTGLFSRLAEN
ncbi:MAG: response regulator [Candidatus Kariarchaeaceae archaeon]|jgi:FixJ family two-component response regulator